MIKKLIPYLDKQRLQEILDQAHTVKQFARDIGLAEKSAKLLVRELDLKRPVDHRDLEILNKFLYQHVDTNRLAVEYGITSTRVHTILLRAAKGRGMLSDLVRAYEHQGL